MCFLYVKTVRWTIPVGVKLFSALCINISVTGSSAISWGNCVGRTIFGFLRQVFSYFTVESFAVRERTCVVSSTIVLVKSPNNILSAFVAVVRYYKRHCVVLFNFCKQRHVGFCGLHNDSISFGLRNPGVSLCLFKCSLKVRFKITLCFVESLFAEPLP